MYHFLKYQQEKWTDMPRKNSIESICHAQKSQAGTHEITKKKEKKEKKEKKVVIIIIMIIRKD